MLLVLVLAKSYLGNFCANLSRFGPNRRYGGVFLFLGLFEPGARTHIKTRDLAQKGSL